MANIIPPPPADFSPQNQWAWINFYRDVREAINNAANVTWANLDFTGSNITDIVNRSHNNLQSLQGGTSGEYYHLTAAQHTSLTALTGANPTASVGLSAVNGSASSYMRSDGAPALSQSIVPTWTGIHKFTASGDGANSAIQINANRPSILWTESDAAADTKKWHARVESGAWSFSILNDAESIERSILSVARSTTSVSSLSFGNTTNNPSYTFLGSGNITSSGNLVLDTAGKGIQIKEGSNAKMGTATLVAGTVTVNTTAVTANTRIMLTGQNSSGTHGELTISARVAGTSFTITSSSATDTRVVAWILFEPA